jgi:hypothetical protein
MDPSANSSQDQQGAPTVDHPINRVQPPVTAPRVDDNSKSQTQTTISVNKESGPAVIVQKSGDNDEEEIHVASQETKNQVVQQGGGGIEVQEIEARPAIPEPKIEASVEHVIEKSADVEKPVLSESVKQAGVTHSGPGIIPDKIKVEVGDNNLGIKTLPITYEQAALEEKQTEFKSSKHWLMGIYEYVWRKINPALGTKEKKK